jgi:hypothetical protein
MYSSRLVLSTRFSSLYGPKQERYGILPLSPTVNHATDVRVAGKKETFFTALDNTNIIMVLPPGSGDKRKKPDRRRY